MTLNLKKKERKKETLKPFASKIKWKWTVKTLNLFLSVHNVVLSFTEMGH